MTSKAEYKCYNCQRLCKRGDPSLIRAVGNLYHKECFNCHDCQVSVIEKFYIMESATKDVILCERDYFKNGFNCHQCNQRVIDDNYEIIGIYKYHKQCLQCPGCTMDIPSSHGVIDDHQLFDYNNRPYCRYHYSLIKGTECVGCGQTILNQQQSQGQEKKWHLECYHLMKHWHIRLIDLDCIRHADYANKNQLVSIQNDVEKIRCDLWKHSGQFEEETFKVVSNVLLLHHSLSSELLDSCQLLYKRANTIFSGLDLVFKYFTNITCDESIQKFTNVFIALIDDLCLNEHDAVELKNKCKLLSEYSNELLKLSLQQTLLLEKNFGQGIIYKILEIYSQKTMKRTMDISYIQHDLQLIEVSMTKLGFVFNAHNKPLVDNNSISADELYKSSMSASALLPPSIQQQHKRMVNSTVNIHQYLNATTSPPLPSTMTRSKSSSVTAAATNNVIIPTTNNNHRRMDTFKRALTTTKKDNLLNRSNSIFSTNINPTKDKTYSTSLSISLPDVEQLNTTTPPLSPPTQNTIWIMPEYLPDLIQQQDCIARHVAVLFYTSSLSASHVDQQDDMLASLLDLNTPKKSLWWGKLKKHILTPTAEHNNNVFNQFSEKKIGVSLSNTYHGSLANQNYNIPNQSTQFNEWKQTCPSVLSCFASNSMAPNFLKDCIFAMIEQDIHTEGIFRKNGNIRVLKEMCHELDTDHARQEWKDFFRQHSIIQLAAFLKRFLRELPEPLLTYKLHPLFIKAHNHGLTMLHYTMCMLPKINRDILLLVLSLLNWVARHENKMGFENLARVMTPNILYHHTQSSATGNSTCVDVTVCHNEIQVVATMIEHYETLCKVPKDFNNLLENPRLIDYTSTNNVDLTNSKHIVKSFHQLSKLKREIVTSSSSSSSNSSLVLPPSPL